MVPYRNVGAWGQTILVDAVGWSEKNKCAGLVRMSIVDGCKCLGGKRQRTAAESLEFQSSKSVWVRFF